MPTRIKSQRLLEQQSEERQSRVRGTARKHLVGQSLRRHAVKTWLARIVSQATRQPLAHLEGES